MEMIGWMALGGLNMVLGILVAVVSFRISNLNTQLAEMERRLSRLEIITSLTDSRQERSSEEAV